MNHAHGVWYKQKIRFNLFHALECVQVNINSDIKLFYFQNQKKKKKWWK